MASDYSFAQFKYVARLLLVHGRAAYKRNSEVVLYSFYKNWLYQLTYIYFGFYTGKCFALRVTTATRVCAWMWPHGAEAQLSAGAMCSYA